MMKWQLAHPSLKSARCCWQLQVYTAMLEQTWQVLNTTGCSIPTPPTCWQDLCGHHKGEHPHRSSTLKALLFLKHTRIMSLYLTDFCAHIISDVQVWYMACQIVNKDVNKNSLSGAHQHSLWHTSVEVHHCGEFHVTLVQGCPQVYLQITWSWTCVTWTFLNHL